MGAIVVLVERRRDGKLHPLGGVLGEREQRRCIALVHQSRHALGLSYRATQRRLEEYGLRASLGSVYTYATQWRCEHCPGPDHEPGQPRTDELRPE